MRAGPDTRSCSSPAGSASRRCAPSSRRCRADPATSSCCTACATPPQIVFRDELEALARARDAQIHYVVGRRDGPAGDPLGADALERLVPDLLERDVYLCGPVPMMERVEDTLRDLGLPDGQIHAEKFAY